MLNLGIIGNNNNNNNNNNNVAILSHRNVIKMRVRRNQNIKIKV
jgi:hypothetical protein